MKSEILILIAFLCVLAGTGSVLFRAINPGQGKRDSSDQGRKNHTAVRTAEDKGKGERLGNLLGFNGLRSGAGGATVQEFLPFEKIEDSMICLGNDIYRMVIEVNSINYYLKTEEEQDTVEAQYRRAISSWHFPWALYVQTREYDNRRNVEDTRKQIEQASAKWSRLSEYGRNYLQYVENLPETTNSSRIKKKFIIIGCDDAYKLKEASPEDKQEYALQQLFRNAQLIITSLKNVGLSAHICRSDELIKMMYQAILKSAGGAEDGLIDQTFLSPIAEGKKETAKDGGLDDSKLNRIIDEFLNRLDVEIMEDPSGDIIHRLAAKSVRNEAEQLRRHIKAYEDRLKAELQTEDEENQDEFSIVIPSRGITETQKTDTDEEQAGEYLLADGGDDETVSE